MSWVARTSLARLAASSASTAAVDSAVYLSKAVFEYRKEKRCFSHQGSGNTSQRQCLYLSYFCSTLIGRCVLWEAMSQKGTPAFSRSRAMAVMLY